MEPSLTLLLLAHETPFIYRVRSFLAALENPLRFQYVRTEREAKLYIDGAGVYANRTAYPLPDLILIDTFNPDGTDLRILSWLQGLPPDRKVAIVLLVDEESSAHLQTALDLGANAYVIKRHGLAELEGIILGIIDAQEARRLRATTARTFFSDAESS